MNFVLRRPTHGRLKNWRRTFRLLLNFTGRARIFCGVFAPRSALPILCRWRQRCLKSLMTKKSALLSQITLKVSGLTILPVFRTQVRLSFSPSIRILPAAMPLICISICVRSLLMQSGSLITVLTAKRA